MYICTSYIPCPHSLKTFPGTCKRNFLCLQIFLEHLPLVEQYHTVNISSPWLDPERVIGQQVPFFDLFLILWCLLRYDKSTSNTELNSPNYSILFFHGIWTIFVRTRWIHINKVNVSYIFNCMSHYVDFNACFFRGDFSANECSSDI